LVDTRRFPVFPYEIFMKTTNTLPDLLVWPDGVYALDAVYVRPGLAAVHFIVEQGRVAVIDTAHNASLPRFLAALAQLGLAPGAVDYLFLTHVHLDHAGGAGAYLECLPQAKIIVHPRGAPHMIDPARLFAGTAAVYGEEMARRLYGDIVPAPAERVITSQDGEVFLLAGRPLQCLHTPGHAKHHQCLWDARARVCFTGDAFGIAYRELTVAGEPFLIPATTPTQFDPVDMRASIERLLTLAPQAMYLTHFSRLDDPLRQGTSLLSRLDDFVRIAETSPGTGEARKTSIQAGLASYLLENVAPERRDQSEPILTVDMNLSAQGLAWWMEHRD
jgi:hydroxyacylglutathione hydrolase